MFRTHRQHGQLDLPKYPIWGRVGDCVGVRGSAAGSTGCPPAALSVAPSTGVPPEACTLVAAFFLASLGMYPEQGCCCLRSRDLIDPDADRKPPVQRYDSLNRVFCMTAAIFVLTLGHTPFGDSITAQPQSLARSHAVKQISAFIIKNLIYYACRCFTRLATAVADSGRVRYGERTTWRSLFCCNTEAKISKRLARVLLGLGQRLDKK